MDPILEVELEFDIDEPETIDFDLEDNEEEIGFSFEETLVGTNDYRELINRPTINGEELYDNYNEIDPTVPDWAKETMPKEMQFSAIKEVWDSIFTGE